MGEVFAAENIRTGRHVAVKLLRADSKTKSSHVERFRREARAAGSINSDHVTQVLDVEEDAEHGIVLVFELLEGESLIDRLKRTGPIPFDELFSTIEQVWMGLADAHRVGIIHRDLKPSNVFLERRPDGQVRVKILDFGVSKLPKEMGGETLTEMGQSLGTFSFMPPEQISKAKTVDHRADIYACATLIYQALSGQLPYSARNILVMVELKSKSDPRTLSEVMDRPADPRLEAFLKRGLARDPADRFQTAVDALNAWRELRPNQGSPASGSPQGTPSTMTPMPPPASAASAPRASSVPHSTPAVSSPRPNSYPPQQAALAQRQPSYPPQATGAADYIAERRARGGTLAMETPFDTNAPTKPMVQQQGGAHGAQADSGRASPGSQPAIPTRESGWSNMQDPSRTAVMQPSAQPAYQDPRGAHGAYGSISYPPPSPHTQNPYSAQGYASQQPQQQQQQSPHIYDENSKVPPPSQAQTRVYNPVNSANINYGPGSAPMSPPIPSALLATQPPAPAAPQSSSLRVVLWFVAFAVVGFGIVATLHYFSVF